ncbi:ataxin-3 [Canna indica]|uniref:ubiquitinyl hydrolase 1 n=1 Tax=Canna indica TaxID=4628 RepID=A0AAQ3L5A3_9LILI|nr:ataxin-3 [Canna indica]
MAGLSNGGLLYHEIQEGKLCAVHCVNTVLQGPFFSELDLAALASDLDQKERQMMLEGAGHGGASSGDFYSEVSHNVSMGGDFSIQVLQKALEIWDLEVIPLNSPVAEPSTYVPELENAFICHLQDHWFCIRKVNGEWYNFNSLLPAPEHLSQFYLSAYIDSLKDSGWSIFLVRGNFPKDCPIPHDTSVGFGQWLTPEDAKNIAKSCKQMELSTQEAYPSIQMGSIDEQEEEDLNAAIQASLMDSTGFQNRPDITEGGHNAAESATTSSKLDSPNNSISLTDLPSLHAESSQSNTDVTNATSGTVNQISQDEKNN